MKEVDSTLTTANTELGYVSLKDKQKELIIKFISGQGGFAMLLIGYGKSLCYGCPPWIFDQL